MSRGAFWSVIFLQVVLITAASAQLRLTAIPDKTIVEVNEPFRLQFVAEGASRIRNFVPPDFRNFQQLGDVVETRGTQIIDGSLQEYVSYTYRLKALVPGKLSIASAAARMNDRLILSNPFIILAKPPVQPISATVIDPYIEPGESVLKKIHANLYVTAHINKTRCVTGEPVVATFKLYTRLDSESKVLRRSSFNGFSVRDLETPEQTTFTQEVVNGKLFHVYLIRKVQLIPLQSGELEIDPVEVQHAVRLIRRHELPEAGATAERWDALREKIRNSEISAAHRIDEIVQTRTPALTLTVTDPPQTGQPANFSGAVGRFQLQIDSVSTQVQAGGSGMLRLRISGSGNLALVTLPVIAFPKGVNSFEATSQLQQQTSDTAVWGTKIFDVPFSAAPGTYRIGPISFSFYDPERQQYTTLQEPPVTVVFGKGAPQPLPQMIGQQKPEKTYHLLLLPLLLAVTILFWVRWQRRQMQAPQQVHAVSATPVINIPPPAVFLQQQQSATPHIQDGKAAVRLLQQMVRKYAALCSNGAVFSDAAIVQALQQHPGKEAQQQYRRWTQLAEAALFAPPGIMADMQQLRQEALHTMEAVQTAFSSR